MCSYPAVRACSALAVVVAVETATDAPSFRAICTLGRPGGTLRQPVKSSVLGVLVIGRQRRTSRSPHQPGPSEPAWYRGPDWFA